MTDTPRWFTAFEPGHSTRYVERFRQLAADGVDVDGEARFVDALLPRRSRVLDGGCGPGRVGAALFARGHQVVGVDVDPELIEAARVDHPGPRWLVGDLASFDPGVDGLFDAVVLAGNVLAYLTPGSEGAVLRSLRQVLAADGVLVAGFGTEHPYTVAAFDEDLHAAGFVVEQRFATWDLRPWRADADWCVSVLRPETP